MGKREIANAIFKYLSELSKSDGYEAIKMDKGSDVYYFYYFKDNCYCIFSYSIYGRGRYSIDGHVHVKYKILTDVMCKLMIGTIYENDYKVTLKNNSVLKGVGIWSPIGKNLKNDSMLYIDNINESQDIANLFYHKVKQGERMFILPALGIKNTIEKFMKPLYFFWPGDLRSFMEHLISYGIILSDKSIITYAFDKASTVLPKYAEHVRQGYSNFIETLRTKLEDQMPSILPSVHN
jgi:hypothetical protein